MISAVSWPKYEPPLSIKGIIPAETKNPPFFRGTAGEMLIMNLINAETYEFASDSLLLFRGSSFLLADIFSGRTG